MTGVTFFIARYPGGSALMHANGNLSRPAPSTP